MLELSREYKFFVSKNESAIFRFKDEAQWKVHKLACTEKSYKAALGLHPCTYCDCPDFVGSGQVCQRCYHAWVVHV